MKIYFIRPIVGILYIVLYANFSLAQQNQKFDSSSFQTLSPVSVYALKGKQIRQNLKLTNADWVKHDAGEVLLQIPGFSSIKKSGGFGFDPVFRGFKWEQLSILNDGGLTAHAACPNRMDPPSSQVMINQVEKIEIMKGPFNFRYGAATGAIINFKTADPSFVPNNIFGRINIGGESNGEIFRSEGMLGLSTKKLQVSLAGSHSNGQNYKDGNDSIIPAKFNRTAINFNAAYLVKLNQIASINITRNFARNTAFPTLMMDLLSDDTWMIQGKYQVKAKNRWFNEWNTQAFTSMVDHQMGNGLRPASVNMLSHVYANTQTTGGRTEFIIRKHQMNIYLGGDVKYEYANGTRTRSMLTGMMAGKTFRDTLWQQGTVSHTGVFGHMEKRLGDFELTFSSRLDNVISKPKIHSYKFLNKYNELESVDLNPSISMGLNKTFNQKFQTGVWIGRGVRSASITEKFINFLPVGLDAYEVLGNPQLKPESNTQIDFLMSYKNEYTSLHLNLFHSYVQNFISMVVDPTLKPVVSTAPGVRKFINIDAAQLNGFEFNWAQRLWVDAKNELSVAYTRGQNIDLNQPLPEINPLEIRNKITLDFYKDIFTSYINYRYAFNQNRVSKAFNERVTPGFTVIDMGVKYQPLEKLQISGTILNVFDVTYKEHQSRYISTTLPLNAPGRSVVVMASYSF